VEEVSSWEICNLFFLFFYICVKNKSISMLVCFCYLNLQFRVKVTPVDVDFPCNNTVRDGGVDESWDVQDVRNAVKSWPLIEVAVRVFFMQSVFICQFQNSNNLMICLIFQSMSSADCEFQRQQQFGELMDRGSYLIFQAQVTRPESVVS
jgi:hypothetical protein